MNPDLYFYRADYQRIVDGDTVVLNVDLGMRVAAQHSIRVADVNCPELFNGNDRDAGVAAREFTQLWFVQRMWTEPWPFLIRTHKDSQSFNRYVADVWCARTGESLADAIIAAGHGVPAQRGQAT
jgi:endonuclease YncB( thermonuclease family)